LKIEVRGGGLILRGRANSYHAKQLAQHALMSVTELPLIANEIEVADARVSATKTDTDEPAPKPHVVVAVADDRLRSLWSTHLTVHGHTVSVAPGGVECVALLRETIPRAIVLDTDLLWGGADGVLAYTRALPARTVPVVLLGSPPLPGGKCQGRAVPPVVAVLEKPVALDALLAGVRLATDPGAANASEG
jgi:CheY-like chemotaxis protein